MLRSEHKQEKGGIYWTHEIGKEESITESSSAHILLNGATRKRQSR